LEDCRCLLKAKFKAAFELNVALTAEVGVNVIVLSSSSVISGIPEIVKVPVVEPAGIVI
jgi:hypothetical protein